MRSAMLSLLLLAGSEPTSSLSQRERLANEIERAIILPTGASPLNAYGRNYAFSGRDKVVGIYLLPLPPSGLDKPGSCEILLPDLRSRPCTKSEIKDQLGAEARAISAQTRAGKRRWYGRVEDLPFINDGGCMEVSFEYEIATRHFLRIACNGYA